MDYQRPEHNRHGQVPASSTARLAPLMRPEAPSLPSVTILPPTTRPPQPMGFTAQSYERFEAPQHVRQPYHFAVEEPHKHRAPAAQCPVCFTGIGHFRLPHDPTTSVFCQSCRQPYHICPVHQRTLPGMGLVQTDPRASQCQCQRTQAFLGDDAWNSCFHR